MAGGGSSQTGAAIEYPEYLGNFHTGIVGGADTTYTSPVDVGFDMVDAITEASSAVGGSPFALVTGYDVDEDVGDVKDARQVVEDMLDDISASTDVSGYLDDAVTYYDANLVPSTEIDDVVDAFDARSLESFQRDVAGTVDFAFSAGAFWNNQLPVALAQVVARRREQSADFEAKLRLYAQRERTQSVLTIANAMLARDQYKMQGSMALVGVTNEVAQLAITANQDAISQALSYEVQDALWDLNLLVEGAQVMSAIVGAATMPRNLTKGERFTAQLGTALNAGIQGGIAFGNPAAGVGIGVASMGLQMMGDLIDG